MIATHNITKQSKIKVAVIAVPGIHVNRRLEQLNQNIYDITIISPIYSNDIYYKKFNFFSVNINKFKFLKYFQYYLSYAYFILNSNFDIIYCFGAYSSISWLAGLLCNKHLVVSTLGVDVYLDEQASVTSLSKLNIKRLIRNADRVSVLSNYMKQRLISDFKISESKIVEDFLDIEQEWYFNKAKGNKFNLFDNKFPVIFSPRSLQSLYQQLEVVKALPILLKKYPRLLFIQSGFNTCLDYKKKCIDFIDYSDLKNHVVFLENKENVDELIEIFDASDVVVMVPKSDGMPASMIEAWARKKPVVVSNIEHYDSFYHKKLFFKTDLTAVEIANSVNEIVENNLLRETLINHSKEYLEQKRHTHNQVKILCNLPGVYNNRILNNLISVFCFFLFIIEPWFKYNTWKRA